MTEQTHDLLRTAHHEAGHMVAARAFGRPIVAHSIDPDEASNGRIHLWPNDKYADNLRGSLVILAAGAIAQRMYDPTGNGGGGGDDSQMIALGWTLIGRAYGTAEMYEAEMHLAQRRASKLVRDHWGHVEQLAHSLVAQHRLIENGPHVERIGDLDT